VKGDFDIAPPVCGIDTTQRTDRSQLAGGAHQRVEAPSPLSEAFDRSLQGWGIEDVRREGSRLAARVPNRFRHRFNIAARASEDTDGDF
jgi:hypothetical protein